VREKKKEFTRIWDDQWPHRLIHQDKQRTMNSLIDDQDHRMEEEQFLLDLKIFIQKIK
jgi:hypothetical protein